MATADRSAALATLLHRSVEHGAARSDRALTDFYRDSNLYTVEELDQTLTVLADPTRRRIVERLAHGTATVSELVECFDLTQPTISSHLKVLERAGLISRSRVAQTRPCALEPEGLRGLGLWLGELGRIYEQNHARLDAVLENLQNPEEQRRDQDP
jgi:DNA-binding transcriptional ArsR family regulator